MFETARSKVTARRWHASQDAMEAGAELFVLGVVIDKTMTIGQRPDLLGCRHRYGDAPESAMFSELIGSGAERAPGGKYVVGPFMMAFLSVTSPKIRGLHERQRAQVEAFERQQASQKAMHDHMNALIDASRVAARVAAAGGYIHPQPATWQ